MNLEDAAKKLGYFDADHVEKNIEAYGEPLIEWWGLIKELVNELPLNDVNKRPEPTEKQCYKSCTGLGVKCKEHCESNVC